MSPEQITVTDTDRAEASAAIIAGWNRCKRRPEIHSPGDDKPCVCDIGAIDGCKAMREAIAESIAAARKM